MIQTENRIQTEDQTQPEDKIHTKDINKVSFLREIAPYIHNHRGKSFVIAFSGEVIASQQFHQIIQDFAIISSFGVRLVLVHGTRQQIDERLHRSNIPVRLHKNIRITDKPALVAAQEAIGFLRVQIENLLTYALNLPSLSSRKLGIVSGNFITARPLGVHDGIDYGFTGVVRKINHDLIQQQLDAHNIVLLSPMGYSPTGEAYNLRYEEVATSVAVALKADKLIFLSHCPLNLPRELTLNEARLHTSKYEFLSTVIEALETDVERVHLLDASVDGALLLELYTRNGIGSMFSTEEVEVLRSAHIEDISGILELIRPLENQGALIKRSREQLELEINNFHIITRDQKIIACAALYDTDHKEIAELACFAVHPHFQGNSRGSKLLKYITQLAQTQGKKKLLVLTTQTADWFRERGFIKGTIEDLPPNKQSLYNYRRNSQVLFKVL